MEVDDQVKSLPTTVSIAFYHRSNEPRPSNDPRTPRSYHTAIVVSAGSPAADVDVYQIDNPGDAFQLRHRTAQGTGHAGRCLIDQVEPNFVGCVVIGTTADLSVKELGEFILEYDSGPHDAMDWRMPGRQWNGVGWVMMIIHDLNENDFLQPKIPVDRDALFIRLFAAASAMQDGLQGEVKNGVRLITLSEVLKQR